MIGISNAIKGLVVLNCYTNLQYFLAHYMIWVGYLLTNNRTSLFGHLRELHKWKFRTAKDRCRGYILNFLNDILVERRFLSLLLQIGCLVLSRFYKRYDE